MLKIAVLADLHLPDELPGMHTDVLKNAVNCCYEEKADVIVCAGDMVKSGAVNAAKFLLDTLHSVPIPAVITHGNTEQGIPKMFPANPASSSGIGRRKCRLPESI